MILCTIPNLTEEDKDMLKDNVKHAVHFCEHLNEVTINLSEVTFFITYGYDVTKDLLNKMNNLRWITIFQTGFEHIDIEEILGRGIRLTHTKDFHAISIAEYVLSMILFSVRKIEKFQHAQKSRIWDRQGLASTEAFGKTVSIFGTGSIGQTVAQRLKCIQMNTIGVNTSGRLLPYFDEMYTMKDKHEVLKRSDFVVLIMPATEETHHCISDVEFDLMKNNCYLINVGRGALIDTNALIKSLQEDKINGAALDVFDVEPLPIDSPLWNLPNIFITPHIASSTDMYAKRAFEKFLENYSKFECDQPLQYEIKDTKGY